jgi:hypothetical protein
MPTIPVPDVIIDVDDDVIFDGANDSSFQRFLNLTGTLNTQTFLNLCSDNSTPLIISQPTSPIADAKRYESDLFTSNPTSANLPPCDAQCSPMIKDPVAATNHLRWAEESETVENLESQDLFASPSPLWDHKLVNILMEKVKDLQSQILISNQKIRVLERDNHRLREEPVKKVGSVAISLGCVTSCDA